MSLRAKRAPWNASAQAPVSPRSEKFNKFFERALSLAQKPFERPMVWNAKRILATRRSGLILARGQPFYRVTDAYRTLERLGREKDAGFLVRILNGTGLVEPAKRTRHNALRALAGIGGAEARFFLLQEAMKARNKDMESKSLTMDESSILSALLVYREKHLEGKEDAEVQGFIRHFEGKKQCIERAH